MIRILIVHKTEVICNALANLLRAEADLTVVGMTSAFDEAARQLERTPCDLVLLDGSQPSPALVAFIQHLTRSGEVSPKVLVIGLPEQTRTLLMMLQAGASAYALQETSPDALIQQIRDLCRERVRLSPEVAFALIQRVQHQQRVADAVQPVGPQGQAPLKADHPGLTPREQEVLHLLQKRCTNREIAHLLTIELGTVKNHVHSILQKLNVDSRRAAAEIAREHPLSPL